MYKYRFQQWGFRKYMKASKSEELQRQAAPSYMTSAAETESDRLGSEGLMDVVGRANQKHQLELELYRRCLFGRGFCAPDCTCRSRIQGSINLPESLRNPEKALHAVLSYSRIQFDEHNWNLATYEAPKDPTTQWGRDVELAAFQLDQKRDVAAQFQLFSNCCGRYRGIVRRQDPFLIWVTLNALLRLAQVGEDLALSFNKFVASMCEIDLNPKHPLTELWKALLRMGPDGIRRSALAIIEAQFDLFQSRTDPGNTFPAHTTVLVFRGIAEVGLMSMGSINQKMEAIIKSIERNSPGPHDEDYNFQLNRARLHLVCQYNNSNQFVSADRIIKQIEYWHRENWHEECQFQCGLLRAQGGN